MGVCAVDLPVVFPYKLAKVLQNAVADALLRLRVQVHRRWQQLCWIKLGVVSWWFMWLQL